MRLIFGQLVQQVILLGCQLQVNVVVLGLIHELGLYKSRILDPHSPYTHSFSTTDVLRF